MKYTINQKNLFKSNYEITDENGNIAYYADSNNSLFRWERNIYDRYDQKIAYMIQKARGFKSYFEIYVDEQLIGKISRKGSLFKNEYLLENSDLEIIGNFMSTHYDLINDEGEVATIYTDAFSFKHIYDLDIDQQYDPIIGISIALAIDIINKQKAAAAA